MEKTEFSASNFIPENLLNIIYILERDEKHHSYKIIRSRNNFTLIAKFPAENAESTSLNNASVQQAASHRDKKQNSSEDKLRNSKRKRGKIKTSSQTSGVKSASRHTDKNPASSMSG